MDVVFSACLRVIHFQGCIEYSRRSGVEGWNLGQSWIGFCNFFNICLYWSLFVGKLCLFWHFSIGVWRLQNDSICPCPLWINLTLWRHTNTLHDKIFLLPNPTAGSMISVQTLQWIDDFELLLIWNCVVCADLLTFNQSRNQVLIGAVIFR